MTRAERTNFRETSGYTDVVAFVDSLRTLGAPLAFGSIGRTAEAREIPYVVASRPLVRTPAEARISILSEAFSHDSFEVRVNSTYAFPNSAPVAPVRFEILARTGDTLRTQPGLDRGLRRTGEIRTRLMAVFDRFVPAVVRPIPQAYFVSDTATVAPAWRAGRILRFSRPRIPLRAIRHRLRGAISSAIPGNSEVRRTGHWEDAGTQHDSMNEFLVRTAQPLGRLAMYLLDPESDDGLVTWNVFDRWRATGFYPVLRSAAS